MPQASALITNSPPSNFGHLWTYLVQQPEYQTTEERRALNKRLREFLLKQWVTIGVPKIAIAAFALIKEEKPGDADLGFSKYVTPSFFVYSIQPDKQEGFVGFFNARNFWHDILTGMTQRPC